MVSLLNSKASTSCIKDPSAQFIRKKKDDTSTKREVKFNEFGNGVNE